MNRIEICGNIASGKTTLCRGFASKDYHPIFEDFQKNPFYEKFYEAPQEFSFETEVTFLFQHYHAIKTKKNIPRVACDYSLFLDMAYADVNLSGERHRIFSDIVKELQDEIGQPSKIVYLICREEVLLQRIISRSRDVETSITIEYLKSLNKALSTRLKRISNQIQVITIDSKKINFTHGIEGIPELK